MNAALMRKKDHAKANHIERRRLVAKSPEIASRDTAPGEGIGSKVYVASTVSPAILASTQETLSPVVARLNTAQSTMSNPKVPVPMNCENSESPAE